MIRLRLRVALLAVGVGLCVASAKDPEARADGADEAASRALFEEGRRLMDEGHIREACPKFEEGQRLSPGIGMKFNLADCYERAGRLASAWAAFLDVAASAKAQNQPEREKAARRRAAALEPELARLTIIVPSDVNIPGLEVQRDGVLVGRGQWGSAIPVDAGQYVIRATAPGRIPFEAKVVVDATPNAKAEMRISALKVDPNASATPGVLYPANRGNGQRTLGLLVGGAGILTLGVGVTLGLLAVNREDASDIDCFPGNRCNAVGVGLRNDAISLGNAATITLIAGGVAVAGAAAIYFLAPQGGKPQVGFGPGNVLVRGSF